VFNIQSGNVIALITAINTANSNRESNTIELAPGDYMTAAVEPGNGFPTVTGTITIN
jgi:hypothetical protein